MPLPTKQLLTTQLLATNIKQLLATDIKQLLVTGIKELSAIDKTVPPTKKAG